MFWWKTHSTPWQAVPYYLYISNQMIGGYQIISCFTKNDAMFLTTWTSADGLCTNTMIWYQLDIVDNFKHKNLYSNTIGGQDLTHLYGIMSMAVQSASNIRSTVTHLHLLCNLSVWLPHIPSPSLQWISLLISLCLTGYDSVMVMVDHRSTKGVIL